jgi:hypothetical protein
LATSLAASLTRPPIIFILIPKRSLVSPAGLLPANRPLSS